MIIIMLHAWLYIGILAGIWPCGTITMIGELFGSESLSQVYAFLHTFMCENQSNLLDLGKLVPACNVTLHSYHGITSSGTICYDDGCHLKKYANKRVDLTETAGRMASCAIVVDKMHFKGHTDGWCQKYCNPYELEQLRGVSILWCSVSINMRSTVQWSSKYILLASQL